MCTSPDSLPLLKIRSLLAIRVSAQQPAQQLGQQGHLYTVLSSLMVSMSTPTMDVSNMPSAQALVSTYGLVY